MKRHHQSAVKGMEQHGMSAVQEIQRFLTLDPRPVDFSGFAFRITGGISFFRKAGPEHKQGIVLHPVQERTVCHIAAVPAEASSPGSIGRPEQYLRRTHSLREVIGQRDGSNPHTASHPDTASQAALPLPAAAAQTAPAGNHLPGTDTFCSFLPYGKKKSDNIFPSTYDIPAPNNPASPKNLFHRCQTPLWDCSNGPDPHFPEHKNTLGTSNPEIFPD